MPHVAVFSTELLRRYFAARGYGVYAAGRGGRRPGLGCLPERDHGGVAPAVEELRSRERRRLLFYARPEPHGARNMFELGLLGARARAVAAGVFDASWDFYGIGAVGGRDSNISLGGGRRSSC